MRPVATVFALTLLLLAATLPIAAAGGEEDRSGVELDRWLQLDPIDLRLPASPAEADGQALEEAAEARRLDTTDRMPAEGEQVRMPEGSNLRWQTVSAEAGGIPDVAPAEGADGALVYLVTYVETDRFTEASLTVETPHTARVLVEGAWKACTADSPVDLTLVTGTQPLWLEIVRPAGAAGDGLARVELAVSEADASIGLSPAPDHALRLADVLEVVAASKVQLSHDGRRLAIALADPAVPAEDRRRWSEIRDAADGRLLRDSGAGSWDQLSWAPDGDRFAYVVDGGDGGAQLWIDTGGQARKIAEDVPGLEGLAWAPDGQSLFYAAEVSGEDAEEGDEELAHRVRSLADRREDFRQKVQLFQIDVHDGTRRQLTGGPRSARLHDLHPDGEGLLFGRTVHHDDRRPFESTALWELDLSSLEARRLATVGFGARAHYAPEGSQLLVQAGPSAFEKAGSNLSYTRTPNDYDEQLFLLDPERDEVTPLTRDFAPSISAVHVPERGRHVYLEVVDGPARRLYRLEVDSRRFEPLETGVETIDTVSVSRDGSRVAWIGSSADLPPRVGSSPAGEGSDWSPATVSVPAAAREQHLELGSVEDWDFQTGDGTRIDGRVHYPPDFDPAERYPAIVYYYGGTSPVTRDFGGRYPKNLWAAHGYVVYVLQPSGAIGYGQEFSARHVNDWGKRVADEIIAATESFLAAHEFVDPDRVGCIGASFGGFMTQLLITKTDLFDAAVSHAGISSISSYWGEGHWGYLYNAVSAAGSYPWNRPELYVDRSPLFHANAISTPLLLLHGSADPNVPPGESRQMFTALRVLGKPVELIEIPGEPHWILQLGKRRLWSETIIAWFDRELRDRPAYWHHLYPQEDGGERGRSVD